MYYKFLILSIGLMLGWTAQAQQTLVYGTGRTASGAMDLLADLYQPRGACTSPRPTAVYAHGGGFRTGSRQTNKARTMAAAYTRAGFNFVSIDYRLHGDDPVINPVFEARIAAGQSGENYPGQARAAAAAMEDMNTAMRALANNAAVFCVDPEALIVLGSSAGAVMALNYGYSMDEFGIAVPDVAAVIDLWGASLNPSHIDRGDVPLFIVHGEQDTTTPFAAAEAYWARGQATGTPVHFHAFQNTGHGVDLRRRVDDERLVSLIVAFSEDVVAGRPIQSVRTRN